ncbi:methylated-DNA--protein-cysteine methyltransferase [Alphaproteobacteria bacterium]|nr:methylated-DNA--protein-cysteine methyltransferase [Alphaproteobacteria bacterium]
MEKMNYFSHETIIGNITICANKKAITRLCFGECSGVDIENAETEIIKRAFAQLTEYLNGSRKRFDLKLEYNGSDFQMSVWNQLKRIPYGKTKTYREIAGNINNPKSSLAVGGACGKNPIPVFIPCHRVIGSNGNLTGFAGGINLKKKLLEIESCNECN